MKNGSISDNKTEKRMEAINLVFVLWEQRKEGCGGVGVGLMPSWKEASRAVYICHSFNTLEEINPEESKGDDDDQMREMLCLLGLCKPCRETSPAVEKGTGTSYHWH
jgi:hypothetical protein